MKACAARALHCCYRALTGVVGLVYGVWCALFFRNCVSRRERRALYPAQQIPAAPIWVHAVSAGEAAAACAIIREIKAASPSALVVLACTTPEGLAMGRKKCPSGVPVVRSPLDTPRFIRRFIRSVAPRMIVVVEIEIWPNLYRGAAVAGVPLCLVNARMPDREFSSYRLLRFYFSWVFSGVSLVAAQDDLAALRYTDLGALRVIVAGNVKFDAGSGLVAPVVPQDGLVVVGSLHKEEECLFLGFVERLLSSGGAAGVVLAPRHPERGPFLRERLSRVGIPAALRTSGGDAPPPAGVLVLDSVGELAGWYGRAVVAVIGGSFSARVGGHNPLEAAMRGVPVVYGPSMAHFAAVGRVLEGGGGSVRVQTAEGLFSAVRTLLQDRTRAREMGRKGRRVCLDNGGASERIAGEVLRVLGGGDPG